MERMYLSVEASFAFYMEKEKGCVCTWVHIGRQRGVFGLVCSLTSFWSVTSEDQCDFKIHERQWSGSINTVSRELLKSAFLQLVMRAAI